MSAEHVERVVDLHCHSSASGGAIGKPPEIAAFFKARGYLAFGLTEHDTFSSLDAAREAAADVGIEYVPGIEVSARVDDPELPERVAHILGFFYERTRDLVELVRRGEYRQSEWVRTGLERLRCKGALDVTEEEIRAMISKVFGPDDVWKRTYSVGPVGDVLREKGVLPPDSGNNGVRRMLAEVYPESERPPLPGADSVCRMLREAGAVVMLAHPGGPRTEPGEAERRRLEVWLGRYVDGLEVYTPKHNEPYRRMELDLLKSLARPFCGGTDTHAYGEGTPWSDAPYACLESIREFSARPRGADTDARGG